MKGTVLTWLAVALGIVATGGDQSGALNAGLLVPAVALFLWGVRRWKRSERTSRLFASLLFSQ